jgi:hypothetical protein
MEGQPWPELELQGRCHREAHRRVERGGRSGAGGRGCWGALGGRADCYGGAQTVVAPTVSLAVGSCS